jgi:cation diffusion facilitator CzcD-associated flavoprotein CzcO
MQSSVPVAIIGAGPYGLSVASHLRARGVDYRIFGLPMESWKTQMPVGMKLKSEGFASSLSDPGGRFPLAAYCQEKALPYSDVGLPVPIETFIDYGTEFQRRFVPDVDQRKVAEVKPLADGFELTLQDGEKHRAAKVVVAVGVGYFPNVPDELKALPSELVSHSSAHSRLEHFANKEVTVIGAGSSAADIAVLLHGAGASVRMVARGKTLSFNAPPERGRRSLRQRLRHPRSGLGIGWRSRLCEDLPLVFRRMPERFRVDVVGSHLGPSGPWFSEETVKNNVTLHLGSRLKRATARGDKVFLTIENDTDGERELEADHIISATGYRSDLGRLPFMTADALARIKTVARTPVLSSRFESSIPGLFFIGPLSAHVFGPLMRFSCGNRFAARRLVPYIA